MQKLNNEFKLLYEEVKKINPEVNLILLNKAWNFACLAHEGHNRLTGDPYVSHSLEVAKILTSWHLDLTTIVSGLLHDTVEDAASIEDIKKEFGDEIAQIVDGVTRVTELRLKGKKEEVFVESLRKLILVMAKDLRVVFVKLADRLHNMQTLYALSPDKQKENALETLEIYAPLAERLGIGNAKSLLQDLAFPYAYKNEYEKVKKISAPYYKRAEEHTTKMIHKIKKRLEREGIKGEVHGRKKHLYSLWKKLERPEIDWNFDKINDIVALRILVSTIPDCYVTLGIVHSSFRPVPAIGISDFIAQPKPNGYRSIHTKVFGPSGRIAEVQIRTYDMHQEAETGVAAHWSYSETKSNVQGKSLDKALEKKDTNKLGWVKELIKWQEELKDTAEFLESVKFDGFQSRNFVFSPKGDVYDLPKGATPVDFAFAVHTKLGTMIEGARVNGKLVPLNHELKSGDVVEILKSKAKKGPNRDWIKFVVTTTARREINKYIKKLN